MKIILKKLLSQFFVWMKTVKECFIATNKDSTSFVFKDCIFTFKYLGKRKNTKQTALKPRREGEWDRWEQERKVKTSLSELV